MQKKKCTELFNDRIKAINVIAGHDQIKGENCMIIWIDMCKVSENSIWFASLNMRPFLGEKKPLQEVVNPVTNIILDGEAQKTL